MSISYIKRYIPAMFEPRHCATGRVVVSERGCDRRRAGLARPPDHELLEPDEPVSLGIGDLQIEVALLPGHIAIELAQQGEKFLAIDVAVSVGVAGVEFPAQLRQLGLGQLGHARSRTAIKPP